MYALGGGFGGGKFGMMQGKGLVVADLNCRTGSLEKAHPSSFK